MAHPRQCFARTLIFLDRREQSCLLAKAYQALLLLQEQSWWERPTWISLLLDWWEPGLPLALPQIVLTRGVVFCLAACSLAGKIWSDSSVGSFRLFHHVRCHKTHGMSKQNCCRQYRPALHTPASPQDGLHQSKLQCAVGVGVGV